MLSDFVAEILCRMPKCCSFLQGQGVLGPYAMSGRCWMVKEGKTFIKEEILCLSDN